MSLLFCALFAYLYISSSVFFDILHYFFHQWSTSQWKALQWLSRCHQYHHLYYNRSLAFNRRYQLQNAWIALPLEMACLVTGGLLGWFLLQLMWPSAKNLDCTPLIVVLAVHLIRTLIVIGMSGRDSNHINYKTVPKDPHWLFVGPQFHALHHVDPDRYMSSVVKLFDWVAGTAYTLRKKNIVITGGSGAFGSAIQQQLRSEGVKNIRTLKFGTHWTHRDFGRVGLALDEADILILAHGTKGPDAMEANCDSAIRLIELFMERRVRREGRAKTLPEIWYVGSEAELHPAFGGAEMRRYAASKRAFLPYARALYDNPQIVYRHIVPAAFHSSMGKAIVSPEWAAGVTMWWIRRGACYVPVTYTGIAYLNFWKFTRWVRPDLSKFAGINKAL
ncbi:hypothetical protein BJX96DRAFT_188189 [Aspergillus floccosus]